MSATPRSNIWVLASGLALGLAPFPEHLVVRSDEMPALRMTLTPRVSWGPCCLFRILEQQETIQKTRRYFSNRGGVPLATARSPRPCPSKALLHISVLVRDSPQAASAFPKVLMRNHSKCL